MFKYFFYKVGHFIVNRLPVDLAYKFAMFLSDLQYVCSFRDRQAVYNNLKAVLPEDDDLCRKTREVFRNFGRYLVEFFRMEQDMTEEFIGERIQINNLDRIKEALSHKKGVIVVTGHIGNWEMGAALLSRLGYPATVIALPHKERPVNDLFNYQREIHGLTIVSVNLAARKCMEALKNNRVVDLVVDRDFTQNGELLDFLGRKTMIPKGAAVFSCRTGAPILPVFLTRNGDGTFTLNIEPPMYPPQSKGGDHVDVEVYQPVMEQYADVLEKQIHQFPTQWLMFRQFWFDK